MEQSSISMGLTGKQLQEVVSNEKSRFAIVIYRTYDEF